MLLGNYNIFNNNPGHAVGGPTDPTIWYKAGTLQGFYVGDAVVVGETEKSGLPSGYSAPYSYALPPTAGGLSSRNNARVVFDDDAALVGGLPGSGSATVTFSMTGTGGLIVSGSGSATITFSSTAVILSVASASGSATVTLTGSAALGAIAGLTGSTTITLSPTATSYAIGYLSGISSNETEFSEAALARAVWTALATDYNASGTMGAKMNAAGAAADPWAVELPGAYADGTAGKIIGSKLLTVARFLGLK